MNQFIIGSVCLNATIVSGFLVTLLAILLINRNIANPALHETLGSISGGVICGFMMMASTIRHNNATIFYLGLVIASGFSGILGYWGREFIKRIVTRFLISMFSFIGSGLILIFSLDLLEQENMHPTINLIIAIFLFPGYFIDWILSWFGIDCGDHYRLIDIYLDFENWLNNSAIVYP